MSEAISDLYTFDSAEELAEKLAEKIADILADAITLNGQASLVVSGGSTPLPLFSKLSKQRIDWQHVTITLADERWVETADRSSNESAVRSHLLQNEGAQAHFISLKNSAATAVNGELEANCALEAISRPFDVVILGMGDDGHTASLFPGAERLPEAVDMHSGKNCIAITPPNAPFDRMSMTLPSLLDTRSIILHIVGVNKQKTLNEAFADGDPADMPIRYVLRQQKVPVQIFWAP